MTSSPQRADDLLSVWFGSDLDSLDAVSARSQTWFQSDDAFDATLRTRFGDLPARAADGELATWRTEPRSALALVLVLDQLPRNLFRAQPEAFAYDAMALEVASELVARGWDHVLHPVESVFAYLPFEHAEDAAVQARSVSLYTALLERAPPGLAEAFVRYLDFAERHRTVIDQFGRFPHRNDVLGRPSTDAESRYLTEGGDTF